MILSVRSRTCITAARNVVGMSKLNGEAVCLDRAIRDVRAEVPDCGLSAGELRELITELVIDERWSLAD